MKSAPWIIIVVLLGIILLQRECKPKGDYPVYLEVISDTIHDTITVSVTDYVPSISYRDTGSVKWQYRSIDTALILSDYFTSYYYKDTLINDTNALFIISDTISQNRIVYRKPQLTIYPNFIKQTSFIKKVNPPKRKLLAGIGIGRNSTHFALSPSLMLITKKQTAYSLSYDLLNRDIYFTMYWKLKFR